MRVASTKSLAYFGGQTPQLPGLRPCLYAVSWFGMRAASLLLIFALVLALAGCKKKPNTTPPPQAQAPTITQPEPQKPPASEPAESKPEPQPEEAQQPSAPPPKPKPKPHRATNNPPKQSQPENKPVQQPPQPAPTQPTPTQQASNMPPKLPQQPAAPAANPAPASPNIPSDEYLHTRGTTDQLLQASENNLKNLKRQLSPDEQQMVQQCRNYIQQARSAQSDGDQVRARTLAMKAHLLSDALVTQ
jgi:outer membrane biosynthesis protein TonB